MKNPRNRYRDRPKGTYYEVYVYPETDTVEIYRPPDRPGFGGYEHRHSFSTATPSFVEHMKRWEWWKVEGVTYVRVKWKTLGTSTDQRSSDYGTEWLGG
jgi:hypothetical protein